MSLGSTYNNNQKNDKPYQPTVYGYRMNNAESSVDQTCITFRYWANNLCISIYPRKQTGNDEVVFDMDNGITIYLSHTKTRILANEFKLFLQDPVNYNSVGVPSGQAVITISNGAEYGKNNPIITIRKITDTGEVMSSFAYEVKTDMYYAIRNYDHSNKTFDSCYDEYKYIEIEQMITLMEEYVKASTNAVAFSVINTAQPSQTRLDNKINSIAASLGVEVPGRPGASKPKYSSNSFFANGSGANGGSSYSSGISYGTGTIDDLE